MPKCDWKTCDVCGQPFAGQPYLEVQIESSERVAGTGIRRVLVAVEATEDTALLRLSRQWYCGGWMTTRAVCTGCVAQLPPAWRHLFRKASLEEWVPIRRLSSGEDESKVTETWLVQQAVAPPAGAAEAGR